MNMIKRISAIAICSAIAVTAMAQSTSSASQSAPPQHHSMAHHWMKHHSPFLMAVHQLGLTDQQKQQIRTIEENSHAQLKSEFASHKGEFSGLMNPGDPNYANAVKAAENAAVAHIEQQSQENQQIYNLLTSDQQAKLPQVIEQMKQHMRQRMEEHHAAKSQQS